MVEALVYEVRSETKHANISHAATIQKPVAKAEKEKKKASGISAETCPKCQKGNILKGKSAFGCSEYKSGCDFVLPFVFHDKKITESQYLRLVQKGSTVNIKGFKTDSGTVEGLIRFEENYKLKLEPKKTDKKSEAKESSDALMCPKCKKGTILKGKTAYGCAEYKSGCDFKVTFDEVRAKLKDQKPTKELVYSILSESF